MKLLSLNSETIRIVEIPEEEVRYCGVREGGWGEECVINKMVVAGDRPLSRSPA